MQAAQGPESARGQNRRPEPRLRGAEPWGPATAPGNVDEDEALDAGQRHLVLLHLQPDLLVQTARLADLLQPDPHVDALVVEPAGDASRLKVGPLPCLKQPPCPMPAGKASGGALSPGGSPCSAHSGPKLLDPLAPACELAGLLLSCLMEVQA